MVNYQLEMDKLISKLEKNGERPSLVLHSCCGPCSSYVLEYLCAYFDITVFYYNPNIYPFEEYEKRKNEQIRLIKSFNAEGRHIQFINGDYDYRVFTDMARGFENEKEGGERCHRCYEFRLRKTAELALDRKADYFSTTLTVSPYKNAPFINELGFKIEEETGAKYLASDFKKRNGYKRSIELSKEYGLYRQDYCGCGFSLAERERHNIGAETADNK